MAGTNPNDVVDDDKIVTEDDLRALKYPDEDVETLKEEDEPSEDDDANDESDETSEEDDKIDDQATEDEETPPAFVKEFDYIKGDTPEEYAKNLEAAYKNSSSEALRLKGELDKTHQAPATAPANQVPADESERKALSPTD